MRGRLINPFKAKIARIDTTASAADPDGAGELTSGYDPVFREPIQRALDVGEARLAKELEPILIPCQVEFDDQFEALGAVAAGNDTNSRVRIVFHFQDLEELGLVDATTGLPKLNLNDRLVAVHRFDDETLIQNAGLEEGFYCTEVRPVSFGLSGGSRNLLVCTYQTRDKAFKAGS